MHARISAWAAGGLVVVRCPWVVPWPVPASAFWWECECRLLGAWAAGDALGVPVAGSCAAVGVFGWRGTAYACAVGEGAVEGAVGVKAWAQAWAQEWAGRAGLCGGMRSWGRPQGRPRASPSWPRACGVHRGRRARRNFHRAMDRAEGVLRYLLSCIV